MEKIQKLIDTMPVNQILIYDAKMIEYFTGLHYNVGERFIGLIVSKTYQPILILNNLFNKSNSINTIIYNDGDDIPSLISKHLNDVVLAIDGALPARFVIPLIDKYSIINGSPYLEACRRIKSKEEQEYMRKASTVNDEIMAKIVDAIEPGMTEIELASIIKYHQTNYPVTIPSFEPIALFGENTADPHGVPSDRTLQKGDLVLIDMGGIVDGYASDMTRCFFYDKNPELEKIYDIVQRANLSAINAVKIGQPLSSVDKAARQLIEDEGYGEFFVHRTGHGIGMEAHENLDVSSANETLIEVGMCFSIEPGIYIPNLGGVRIEDLVTITEDGCEVLNHFPKTLTYLNI